MILAGQRTETVAQRLRWMGVRIEIESDQEGRRHALPGTAGS
jgi:hypothetical protein